MDRCSKIVLFLVSFAILFGLLMAGCILLLYTVPSFTKMEHWLIPALCTQPSLEQVQATMPDTFSAIGNPQGPNVLLQASLVTQIVTDPPFACYVNACHTWNLYLYNNVSFVCPPTNDGRLSYYDPIAPDPVYLCFAILGVAIVLALTVFYAVRLHQDGCSRLTCKRSSGDMCIFVLSFFLARSEI